MSVFFFCCNCPIVFDRLHFFFIYFLCRLYCYEYKSIFLQTMFYQNSIPLSHIWMNISRDIQCYDHTDTMVHLFYYIVTNANYLFYLDFISVVLFTWLILEWFTYNFLWLRYIYTLALHTNETRKALIKWYYNRRIVK